MSTQYKYVYEYSFHVLYILQHIRTCIRICTRTVSVWQIGKYNNLFVQ